MQFREHHMHRRIAYSVCVFPTNGLPPPPPGESHRLLQNSRAQATGDLWRAELL